MANTRVRASVYPYTGQEKLSRTRLVRLAGAVAVDDVVGAVNWTLGCETLPGLCVSTIATADAQGDQHDRGGDQPAPTASAADRGLAWRAAKQIGLDPRMVRG